MGIDEVSSEVLRALPDPVIIQLAHFFNQRMDGFKPEGWGRVIVSLLPKHDKATKVEESRPIALLSVIEKAYERCLAQMTTHALQWVDPSQLGFRPGRQAQELLGTLKLACQKAAEFETPLWAFQADIRKAFDTVRHDALAKAMAIRHVHPAVITAHLRELVDSELRIQIPGTSEWSDPVHMTRGIRQGSAVSPLLWSFCLLYTSDAADDM
eukprot:8812972-Alexandrium_andersonii.AAC.1